jgi:glucokinase
MYIVADIGGTKTRIAGSSDLKSFLEPTIVPTIPEYTPAIAEIADHIVRIAGGEDVEGVAIGLPFVLSRDKRVLRTATNLPLWNNRDFASDLEHAVGAHVVLENDADQVGLGEAVFGAGRGAGIVAYLTVSTGVGGTRIVQGQVDPSFDGFEPGGQYLSMDEPLRNLEDMISGKAIHQRASARPEHLGSEHPIWPELARILAFAVHNTIVYWSLQCVVLGGSLVSDTGIQLQAVREEVARIIRKFPAAPEIVRAELGDVGGLWGGLVRLRHLKSQLAPDY